MTPDIAAQPFAWPVAAYFAMAAIGTGAAMASASGSLVGFNARPRLLLLAVVTVAFSTLFLVLDLSAPARFWHVVTHFNVSSAISWGTRAVGLFLIAAGLAWLLQRDEPADARPGLLMRALLVVVLLLAAYVAWYPGWVLQQAVARPVWQTPLIGWLFLASAAHIAVALGRLRNTQSYRLEIAFAVLQLLLMATYLIGLRVGVGDILLGRLALLFWVGVVGLGWVAPVWLVHRGHSAGWRIAAVIVGAASLRFLILEAGQGGSVFLTGS